jgi:hypothetical protein
MALVIGGHARSGTTLLTRMCNLHPQIQVTMELHNFASLNVGYWEHLRGLRLNWYRFGYIGRTGREAPFHSKLRSAAFLAQYLLLLFPSSGGLIGVGEIERVLHAIFPQARVVGDKFPRYVFRLDDLAREAGLQRVIIYRDGRDVVSSTLQKVRTAWKDIPQWRGIRTASQAAQQWVRAIQEMEKHRSQAYCVRYESLVGYPAAELKALGEWLGVDPGGFSPGRVHAGSVGKYRQGLSPEELEMVLEVAGPTLERLGYL